MASMHQADIDTIFVRAFFTQNGEAIMTAIGNETENELKHALLELTAKHGVRAALELILNHTPNALVTIEHIRQNLVGSKAFFMALAQVLDAYLTHATVTLTCCYFEKTQKATLTLTTPSGETILATRIEKPILHTLLETISRELININHPQTSSPAVYDSKHQKNTYTWTLTKAKFDK